MTDRTTLELWRQQAMDSLALWAKLETQHENVRAFSEYISMVFERQLILIDELMNAKREDSNLFASRGG